MSLFTPDAALDADALLGLVALGALLGGIEVLKGIRHRREATTEQETKEALGEILAGLIFIELFIAFVALGIALGQSLVTLPHSLSAQDWPYVVGYLTPLIIVGWLFIGELRSLRRAAR